MDLESSTDLSPKNEEYRPLSSPELKKHKQNAIIHKKTPPEEDSLTYFFFLIFVAAILISVIMTHDWKRVGINKDGLGQKMDINKLTDKKKLSQFFQKHDINGDERLDGKELLLGMLHLYQDTLKKLNESERSLSNSELSWMADFLLKFDGRNVKGFVYYSGLLPKKKVTSKYSYPFKSSKKKWCSAKTTYNRPKRVQSSVETKSTRKDVQAVKSPMKSPVKSPVKSPMKSPMKSPVKSPVKSPMKSPMKSPVKSPVKSPMKSPQKSIRVRNSGKKP